MREDGTLAKAIASLGGIGFMLVSAPAHANCVDSIAGLALVQPALQRIWQNLQQQTQFPWGRVNPYQRLVGGRIELSPAFDQFTGAQKVQTLAALKLEYSNNWFDTLTPAEQKAALESPEIGAIAPHAVYASDGRALSLPYDGCTRTTLLTEKDRYSWYYNQVIGRSANLPQADILLRNSGRPPWRTVKFTIPPNRERAVRLRFWQAIGYQNAERGWWIAWVPEQGYFEINVPSPRHVQSLKPFWQVAPAQYQYRVLASDGTPLERP